jgi:hypothetical protein
MLPSVIGGPGCDRDCLAMVGSAGAYSIPVGRCHAVVIEAERKSQPEDQRADYDKALTAIA